MDRHQEEWFLVCGVLVLILAVKMLVFGFIGHLIGRSKGRGVAGFWLGCGLSWIGWIITAPLAPVPCDEEGGTGVAPRS